MQSKRGTEWKNEAGEGNSWQERKWKDNFRSGRELITKKGSRRINAASGREFINKKGSRRINAASRREFIAKKGSRRITAEVEENS